MGTSVITSIRELERLRDEWEPLASQAACPTFDHDWFVACAEAFYSDAQLRIVVTRQQGALAGAAPLAVETSASGNRLALLGAAYLYEPSGWVFTAPPAIHELAHAVVALGEPVLLQRIPAESPICAALPGCVRGRAIAAVRTTASSLGVDTRGSWDDYSVGLSSRITENLPRLRRRAVRARGRVQVEHSAPAAGDVDVALETLATVESSGWKGRQGSSLASRADLREFFRRYCRRAAERGRLRFATLSFGSQVAAAELAVEAYGRLWQLKIGYLDALASYYPGLQLTEASIREAFARRLASYEFLGSAESWEERWKPEPRRYRVVALYPLSRRGVAGACRDFAGAVWRRAQWQRTQWQRIQWRRTQWQPPEPTRSLAAGSQMPDAGPQMPDPGSRMADPGCRMPDAGCRMPSAGRGGAS